MKKNTYLKMQPWLIWGLGASFFFAEYFARIAPSVMTVDLMKSFAIGAEGVSVISAFFYFTYVIMQIPAGSLIDRFGAHRLLTFMAAFCALGCILFAVTHEVWVARLSRFIIGFGAAFAFIGTLKLATIWFEPRRLGLLAGLTQGLGMLGAAVGAAIFSLMVSYIGWRLTMMVIALILLLVALMIGFIVRDKRANLLSHNAYASPLDIKPLESVRIVLRNSSSWVITLYSGFIYAPTAVFAELWSIQYLSSTYHLSKNIASLAEGTIFVGLAVGCPLIGWLSDSIGRRKPLLFVSSFLSFILIAVIILSNQLALWVLFLVLFLYGVCNSGVSLSYAVAGELNPRSIAGVSIAFTNMASILLGGFFFQPLFGWLLDLAWKGDMLGGVPYYTAQNFHHAFMCLPLCALAACLLSLLVRETYCRGK